MGYEEKSNFRQTEIGLIPEDWNCVLIPKIIAVSKKLDEEIRESSYTRLEIR